MYAVAAVGLGGVFLLLAWRVFASRAGETREAGGALYDVKQGDAHARNLFAFSILYLFVLFAALLVEHGLGLHWPIGSFSR